MKKYILGLLIATTSIISFTSANLIFTSFEESEEDIYSYIPSDLITNYFNLNSNNVVSYTCPSDFCSFCISADELYCVELKNGNLIFNNPTATIDSTQETIGVIGYNTETDEYIKNMDNLFTQITLKSTSNSAICSVEDANYNEEFNEGEGGFLCPGYTGEEEGGNTGGGGEGGEGGEGGDNSGIDLISSAGVIIDGLENTTYEVIPYVVYIGLGVLGLIIGFVAIRWLINFVRNNIFKPFR